MNRLESVCQEEETPYTLKLRYNDPFNNKILAIKNSILSPSVVDFIVKSLCDNKTIKNYKEQNLQICYTDVSLWLHIFLKLLSHVHSKKPSPSSEEGCM
jgi:hypothetical protein